MNPRMVTFVVFLTSGSQTAQTIRVRAEQPNGSISVGAINTTPKKNPSHSAHQDVEQLENYFRELTM